MKKVGIIMGSDSDLPILRKAMDTLDSLGIPYEAQVYSAHRTPGRHAHSPCTPGQTASAHSLPQPVWLRTWLGPLQPILPSL